MDYKIYFYALIILLICSPAYAGIKTDTATADIVAISIAMAQTVAASGYVYIYVDPADDDVKVVWDDGTIVVIGDKP